MHRSAQCGTACVTGPQRVKSLHLASTTVVFDLVWFTEQTPWLNKPSYLCKRLTNTPQTPVMTCPRRRKIEFPRDYSGFGAGLPSGVCATRITLRHVLRHVMGMLCEIGMERWNAITPWWTLLELRRVINVVIVHDSSGTPSCQFGLIRRQSNLRWGGRLAQTDNSWAMCNEDDIFR